LNFTPIRAADRQTTMQSRFTALFPPISNENASGMLSAFCTSNCAPELEMSTIEADHCLLSGPTKVAEYRNSRLALLRRARPVSLNGVSDIEHSGS
jgi:hypothetical protein